MTNRRRPKASVSVLRITKKQIDDPLDSATFPMFESPSGTGLKSKIQNQSLESMKSKNLIAIACLLSAGSAFGASGIFGSYINVTSSNLSGGVPVWYDAQVPGGGRASDPTDFNGLSFGNYNPSAGGVLNLTGAEILTYKNGGSNVTGSSISYRVYLTGSPTGSFNTIGVNWTSNATFADAAGTSYSGSGDQKWSSISSSANLLTGLSNGNYTVEVFLAATSSDGTHYSSNGGSNYKATFSVVPEPTSAMLGLLGTALLFRRRRI